MIKVKTSNNEIVLTPTIFPDGTSQVWKLPAEILNHREYEITWNFESEREIVDLYSFNALLAQPENLRYVSLHIPYLPYGRQDKNVSNDSTFNLEVLAKLINNLNFNEVTSVDVHNPKKTSELIENFKNIPVVDVHEQVVYDFRPTFIVFPDGGSKDRYGKELSHINSICCDKVRNKLTGHLTGVSVNLPENQIIEPGNRLLIVDDICDGGATFVEVAKVLNERIPAITEIGLFVTHGIFSKGRQHLLDNGIDKIYTTNSILKNEEGYKV